jgi:ABC-type proline/glycine betaine transport system permease subunit
MEQKEEFCGACVAGITALVGAGTAGVTAGKNDRKRKQVIFKISIAVTIISILVMLYLLYVKKCQECA